MARQDTAAGEDASPPGGLHQVADTLGYLAGRWRVERTVYDLSQDRHGTFRGTADFTRGEPGAALRHVERGEFTWGGVTRPASREHLFERAGDGAAFVRFADGRPFHPWTCATDGASPTIRAPRTSTAACSACSHRTAGG